MRTLNEKAQFLARAGALRRFNNWEARHPIRMGEEEALAGVGALYDLMPLESRHRVIDPGGLATMRRALSHLKARP